MTGMTYFRRKHLIYEVMAIMYVGFLVMLSVFDTWIDAILFLNNLFISLLYLSSYLYL